MRTHGFPDVCTPQSGHSPFTGKNMLNLSATVGATNGAITEGAADDIVNPYRARYASNGDSFAIDFVIREVFGTTASKSSSAREMKRKNTTYIVVTKDSNGDEGAGYEVRSRWRTRLRSIFSTSVGNLEPENGSFVAGLVGIWTPVDQAHVMVIASHPSERRRGVGELLVIASLCEAIKIGASNVTLEVRISNNAAQALYRKYGFTDIGIRRRYYSDNKEDALIMATPVFANLDYLRSLKRRSDAYFKLRGRTILQLDVSRYLSLPEQEQYERDESADRKHDAPSSPSLLNG